MAHPFLKITTRQLKKLLRDDRERSRKLTESLELSEQNSPAIQTLSSKPALSQHSENLSNPR